jgi:hypothetical protein
MLTLKRMRVVRGLIRSTYGIVMVCAILDHMSAAAGGDHEALTNCNCFSRFRAMVDEKEVERCWQNQKQRVSPRRGCPQSWIEMSGHRLKVLEGDLRSIEVDVCRGRARRTCAKALGRRNYFPLAEADPSRSIFVKDLTGADSLTSFLRCRHHPLFAGTRNGYSSV